MYIPDFQVLRQETMFFSVMHPTTGRLGYAAVPPGVTPYAVGWLGAVVESAGEVPDACVSTLLAAYEGSQFFSDLLLGSHTCQVCPPTLPQRGHDHPFAWNGRQGTVYGHGHFLIRSGQALYVAPVLILHYMVDHRYQPPQPFIDAVFDGQMLTERDFDFIVDTAIQGAGPRT